MTMLPEAGGEFAVLHAHDTGHGINLGSPPPALVCRFARFSVPAESILKKESHTLHFDKAYPDFQAPELRIHTLERMSLYAMHTLLNVTNMLILEQYNNRV